MRLKRSMFGIMIAALLPVLCVAGVNVRSKSSAIYIDSGSNLVIDNPITNFTGRIVKQSGGTISGQTISFDEGVLENEGNKIRLTGDLVPGQVLKIVLNGSKTFRGKRGEVLENIEIRNKGNLIEGELLLKNPIVLHDAATTVSLALVGRLSQNIVLNGGTIILEDDLYFVDDKLLTGSGTIKLNGRKLSFGAKALTWNSAIYFIDAADVELNGNMHLSATWTFSGSSVLCGSSNILFLDDNGKIVVEPHSSLLISDITIQKVAGTNIHCMAEDSRITFQNVHWFQSADYSFTVGSFDVEGFFDLCGTTTFIFQGTQTNTIKKNARLIFNAGFTFSYDPNSASKSLIVFEDETAKLILKGATLHATATGLQLTKGKLEVRAECTLSSEVYTDPDTSEITLDEGITFGNDNAADDLTCEIRSGAELHIAAGSLAYRNINATSWKMLARDSHVHITSGARLRLYQSLDLGNGIARFDTLSFLERAANKDLTGAIDVQGVIGYDRLV